jgi:hypothetical protein
MTLDMSKKFLLIMAQINWIGPRLPAPTVNDGTMSESSMAMHRRKQVCPINSFPWKPIVALRSGANPTTLEL